MDVYQQRYYRINKIFLTCIGQWPYQARRASYGFLAVLLFFSSTIIGPQILAVVKYKNDPIVILGCISPFIIDLACFVKLINCAVNSKTMLKMLNRISRDWEVWSRDQEVTILHEYAEIGRKMTIAYAVAIYSTSMIYISEPILSKVIDVLFYNGTEPGDFAFPVDYLWLDRQKYYFSIAGSIYVSVSLIIFIVIASDTMFIVHVQHGCGIFTALRKKLERIGESESSINGTDIDYENLATCIDRHNEAIEFAKLIEAAYSGCFFIVVGLNMLIMSVTALQMVTLSNQPQDTIRFIGFGTAQMIHLYIESYISQILMDHSASVYDSIYKGRWYRISLKSQKLLNLMMMRAREPCKITAGKICVMSVETFGMVVKTSMSYFTILRSLQ